MSAKQLIQDLLRNTAPGLSWEPNKGGVLDELLRRIESLETDSALLKKRDETLSTIKHWIDSGQFDSEACRALICLTLEGK